MLRGLLMLAYLALVVYAIADVVQSDEDDSGGLPKTVWIILILFLPLAGSLAWIVVSRGRRARRGPSAPGAGFPAGPVPPAQYPGRRRTWESGPPASSAAASTSGDPDDDPEMRWLLEQARLQRERGSAAAAGQTDPTDPADLTDPDDEADRDRPEQHR